MENRNKMLCVLLYLKDTSGISYIYSALPTELQICTMQCRIYVHHTAIE